MKLTKLIVAIVLILSLLLPASTFAEGNSASELDGASFVPEENDIKTDELPAETPEEVINDNPESEVIDEVPDEESVTDEKIEDNDQVLLEDDQTTESVPEEDLATEEADLPSAEVLQEESESIQQEEEPAEPAEPSEAEEEESIQAPEMESFSINTVLGEETRTSRLGHVKSQDILIYSNYNDSESAFPAGEENSNEVFYIKLQADFEGELYYLISREPSSTNGVVGWVKASDLSTHTHAGVDRESKIFYLKGTGSSYTKAWGGSKNYSFSDLSSFKNEPFKVNLTEKVGNNTWYRGILNGKTAWIHSAYLETGVESGTSRLGHVKRTDVLIYADYKAPANALPAGSTNTNEVFYIKKQAIHSNTLYYLISREPSSSNGVVGWVKAEDLSTHPHVGVDKEAKTFYLKGTGSAYTKAWGGSKNFSYESLQSLENEVFKVNLTEKVGNNVWYRGVIDGKTAWVHSAYVVAGLESNTSRLGHVRSQDTQIYKNYNDSSSAFSAGSANTDEVFYIKSQAVRSNTMYYLISRDPSRTTGVVGWVKAEDLSTHAHAGVDKEIKNYFLKGTGSAYTKAWGGSKNFSFQDLSSFKNEPFTINLTEKVGNNIWYRGEINGKTAWVHSAYIVTGQEKETSQLGHVRSQSVLIYSDYSDPKSAVVAGGANTDEVFYIKMQATFSNQVYYLISRNPSSTSGVVGWVKAEDLSTHQHSGVDGNNKTYYLSGEGAAYTKAWGGSKNIVKADLASLKDQPFTINLTEKVGNNIWYCGVIDGKTAWVHSAFVNPGLETKTSQLGHVRSQTALIYADYSDANKTIKAGADNTNEVFYIKLQSVFEKELYYLISRNPSSTSGVVGWVKASDLSTHTHTGVNNKDTNYYLNGKGSAYTKAWGGSKNIVYSDLSNRQSQLFKVNLTEKVGSNTWYRGVIDGKTAWIHSSSVMKSETTYTQYDISYTEALNRQMNGSPQTDKYRNNAAYVPKSALRLIETSTISENGVRLRRAPNFENNIEYTVNSGTRVTVNKTVTGASHQGSTKWYEVSYAGKVLYVHSSLVNIQSTSGIVTTKTNVYESTNTSSHIYATLTPSDGADADKDLDDTTVTVVKIINDWVEVEYGDWRNAKRSDVDQFMNPDNNDPYQHLVLTSTAGVSASEINKILEGKGVLSGRGQAFIDAGKIHSVNEVYLISHALLETGQGWSTLATGVEVGENSQGVATRVTESNKSSLKNIKKVYNMFGIRAFDNCAVTCGSEYAYTQNWDTPEKAIIGGASFIGGDYIHNQYGQNTIYKMRWNHLVTYKQYATDIGWAAKQTAQIRSFYEMLTNPILRYDLPKFK